MLKIKSAFALLVLLQTAHSLEEYVTRLWETWPPARLAVNLVSSDPERGFIIINSSLIAFGFFCLFVFVLPARAFWRPLAWFWVTLETANGIFHTTWALTEGGYRSGVATAPFLFLTSAYLAVALFASRKPTS